MSEEAPSRVVILDPGRAQLAENARNHWVITVPDGVSIQDIEQKQFWSFFGARLTPYDIVEVRSDTGGFFAMLLVISCDRTWAVTRRLQYIDLDEVEQPEESIAHQVLWKGPHKKWVVIRRRDMVAVQESLQTKGDAYAWMKNHEASIAR
jgi:hypothetical protein